MIAGAVDFIAASAAEAIAARGSFAVALSGGNTPKPVYQRLASAAIDWTRVHVFFSDERCVPPQDTRSNCHMARVALLSGGGIWMRRSKVNGKLCYLWRAVDHEGEVLEAVVTAKRDKAAALKFLKRIMKKYGRPLSVVTDGLCSYPAAMKEIGNADRQEAGRRLNNRAENSHQPFRRRERAMQRFRSMKTLQKFSSVHAQVHNHFNQERHLVTRQVYKQRRAGALAAWRALAP